MDTKVTVRLAARLPVSYDVIIGEGVIDRLGRILIKAAPADRATVISNPDIWRIYGSTLTKSLKNAGLRFDLIEIPEGEIFKSLETLASIYKALVKVKAMRGDALIAFGGGVIGDIAGLAAATYLRGVPFVNVPTTLLAMADSSVGGKTGIDLPEGKNLVGSFYQPKVVVSDVALLRTLTKRAYAEGMAEIVKMAALEGEAAVRSLEKTCDALAKREPSVVKDALARAVRYKAKIIEQDEQDLAGIRAYLNLGHTLAHGLETDGAYRSLTHGEAVSLGVVYAARLSLALGYGEKEMLNRLVALLKGFGLPVAMKIKSVPRMMAIIERDKKKTAEAAVFVLLDGFGKPRVEPVAEGMIEKLLKVDKI